MPKRKILPADYIRRRALFLPQAARYDTIVAIATTDPVWAAQACDGCNDGH